MIREYRDTDWPQVQVLYEKAAAEWKEKSGYDDDIWASNFAPLQRNGISLGAVLTKGDEIQGFIVGWPRSEATFFIDSIYILPGLRGTGLAGRLFGFFNERVRGLGYRWIVTGTSLGHRDIANMDMQ